MLARAARLVIDAVLPPLCLSCGTVVAEPGALCPDCWGRLAFVSAPCCSVCGHPFEFDPAELGEGAVCGSCARKAPPWRRARAVFRYDDASRPLVLRFKHADRLEGAPAFARWMARAGAELLAGADVIVPVPLHRWRLLARRYNQAAVLAMALGRQSGVPVVPDLLLRTRRTPPQGHLPRETREANVKGAFAIHPRRLDRVQGRTVLLVDDVMTTGATIGECARVLARAGASAVDVLTLARVTLASV
ncbi:MAG: double zinc ribbon domain-containing protein [Actinomycetota bacterium]